MGVVYKAEDTKLRRTVALKFLSHNAANDAEVRARLIREAQAAASLDSPNICQIYGVDEEDGEAFVVMAYVDGPSLSERIRERPRPLGEALGTAIQVAEGLQEAYEKGIRSVGTAILNPFGVIVLALAVATAALRLRDACCSLAVLVAQPGSSNF